MNDIRWETFRSDRVDSPMTVYTLRMNYSDII